MRNSCKYALVCVLTSTAGGVFQSYVTQTAYSQRPPLGHHHEHRRFELQHHCCLASFGLWFGFGIGLGRCGIRCNWPRRLPPVACLGILGAEDFLFPVVYHVEGMIGGCTLCRGLVSCLPSTPTLDGAAWTYPNHSRLGSFQRKQQTIIGKLWSVGPGTVTAGHSYRSKCGRHAAIRALQHRWA